MRNTLVIGVLLGGMIFAAGADGTDPAASAIGVESTGAAVSVGAGADSATGSRMNVGQTAIGSMSGGSVILHAGIIPRIIGAVFAPVFGDFSGNRTVDLGDYGQMISCLLGPGVDAGAACALGDSNNDSDVDLRDVAALNNTFGNASR